MSTKTHDSKGRTRRRTQGAAGPKNLPDKKNAATTGQPFDATPPQHLGPHGREWWTWAVRQLLAMKILDTADRKHLELCAETFEDYREAQEDIDHHGRMLSFTTPGGIVIKRNPAFVTKEKSRVTLRSFYSDLGLTPSARVKFGPNGEDDDDPFEALMKARRN